MPLGRERWKVAFGLARAHGRHRYTTLRWVVGIAFTVLIALLPALGVVRFDLWGGNHVVLGEPRDLVGALKAFLFPFLFVNIAILLASRFLGRYLCGFVCPVGALARFSEWVRWRGRDGAVRYGRLAALGAICLVLGAITFSFWIDWRVFLEGSTLAITLAGAFLAALVGGLFALVHWMGLRFCRNYCPSGVYFALLGPETWSGVSFQNPEACTECKACEKVCPMDLQPRSLDAAESREGVGFYPNGMTNHALCIRCGDCVAACEATAEGEELAPLGMGWLGDPRERGGRAS